MTPRNPPLGLAIKKALTPLLCTSAVLAPLVTPVAYAAEEEPEEVVITGSRIRTNGMESPNPTTVVTLEQLELMNPTSLVDALADLPMFNASATIESFNATTPGSGFNFFSSPGNGSLNLRGLGSNGRRTLTLLDGRRVVSSTLFGGPSITLFPQQLMSSVESVTGGASAAYGTDAVAGVVNYKLNTKFQGFRANTRYGILENGRGPTFGAGMSGGFKVGEKTHVLLSAETSKQNPIYGREGFDWYSDTRYMQNPDPNRGNSPQNPVNIPRPMVVPRNSSLDGVIQFPGRTALGSYIMDEKGVASPYVLGTYFDTNNNSKVGGGSGTINDEFTRQFRGNNVNRNYFTYIDHDVNDQLNIFFQGMNGKTNSDTVSVQNFGGGDAAAAAADGVGNPSGVIPVPLIFSGNPYIPANIQAIMTANNIPYLRLNKANAPEDLGNMRQENLTLTTSLTTGFSYRLKGGRFDDWMIKGYYQGGHTDTEARQYGYPRNDRLYLALDAVRDPADPSKIICNVSRFLNDPRIASAKGCKPLNLFGRGQADPAAVDWVTGYDPGQRVAVNGYFINENSQYEPMYYEYESTGAKVRVIDIHQDSWELSADGNLFKGFGAGPIAAAIGYNFREDSFIQNVQAAGDNPAIDIRVRPNGPNNAAIGRRGLPTQNTTN